MEAFSGLERARMLLLLAHINHNKPWSETMKTGWVSWGTVTGVKKDSKDASTEQLLQDSDCSELALSEHRVSFCFPQSWWFIMSVPKNKWPLADRFRFQEIANKAREQESRTSQRVQFSVWLRVDQLTSTSWLIAQKRLLINYCYNLVNRFNNIEKCIFTILMGIYCSIFLWMPIYLQWIHSLGK